MVRQRLGISRGVGELSRVQTFGCTVTLLGQRVKGPCHIEEEKVCCGFALVREGGVSMKGIYGGYFLMIFIQSIKFMYPDVLPWASTNLT